MSLNKPLFVLWLLLLALPLSAQKYERELRIKAAEAPEEARRFVDSLAFEKKVKWYREISTRGISLEAKSKRQKHRYSIEFDTLGRLQDVEITFDWEELPRALRDSICSELCRIFTKVHIVKVQRQLKGSRETVRKYILLSETNAPRIHYELIVAGKRKGEKHQYEITFSENGRLQQTERVILRNTDNLEY